MPETTTAENTTDTTEKNIPKPTPEGKDKQGKQRRLVVYGGLLLIFVILASIFGLFTLFAGKNQPSSQTSTKSKSTESAAKTPSGNKAADAEVYCNQGQTYENKKQGYKVCLIKGWHTSEFNYSAASVGFDSNPIPEASEYGGLIVVYVSNKTPGEVSSTVNNNLESETSSAVTVDGVGGTQISGSIPADSFYFAGYKQVVSVFAKFKRTYEVTMITQPEKLATNQQIYSDFLASWRLIPGTVNPPWSDSGNILVETPWPLDQITNPVTTSGQALVFEGTVSVRIKDANGTTLANTSAQAASGVELSAFSKSVSYTASTTATGTVEVFSISAKDGSEQDKITIPVKF